MPDFVMVLEPTSPARQAFHIREAATLLQSSGADSLASVSEIPHHYIPPKALQLQSDGTLTGMDGTPVREMVHRRQDLPTYYAFNGLIFACTAGVILRDPPTLWGQKVAAYLVDLKYSLDIDGPEDWSFAERRFRQLLGKDQSSRLQVIERRASGDRDG